MPSCSLCKSETKTLYKVNNYQYFSCSICNLLFLHPIPKEKEIETYYRKIFEYTAGLTEEKRIRIRSIKIIQKLLKLHPQGKTLLDIGSGYGYFLDEAKKCNLDITGIEPSKKLSLQSFKRLKQNVFIGNLDVFYTTNKNRRFDFISAIHVIEHVCNPLQFIRQAAQLMNKNGILYIETPNYNSWLAKVEKEHYTFLTPPDHVWLFSLKSFKEILKNNQQLIISHVSSYSYPEHFMGIMKKLVPRHPKGDQDTNLNTDLKLRIENSKLVGKSFKYIAFDKIIAPILTPLLNIGAYGSILELYVKKK